MDCLKELFKRKQFSPHAQNVGKPCKNHSVIKDPANTFQKTIWNYLVQSTAAYLQWNLSDFLVSNFSSRTFLSEDCNFLVHRRISELLLEIVIQFEEKKRTPAAANWN